MRLMSKEDLGWVGRVSFAGKSFNSVCVCVCVCVCVYSSTVKASSVCKISDTCLRGTDQRCYVVSITRSASAKFLHLSIRKCHISLQRRKLQWPRTGKKTNMIYIATAKRWYTDIRCRSATVHNRQVTKRY